MTYTIQREKLVPLWPELMPLLERHRAEVAPFPDWVLSPDYASYAHAEETGRLWLWTVREDYAGLEELGPGRKPGKVVVHPLIGYLIMMVGPSMHYTGTIMASQDVLFIAPEHRKGGLGLRLLMHSERDLRQAGVHCIAQRSKTKPGLDIGRLFKAAGYHPVDEVWLKRLDVQSQTQSAAHTIAEIASQPGQPENPYDELLDAITRDEQRTVYDGAALIEANTPHAMEGHRVIGIDVADSPGGSWTGVLPRQDAPDHIPSQGD